MQSIAIVWTSAFVIITVLWGIIKAAEYIGLIEIRDDTDE